MDKLTEKEHFQKKLDESLAIVNDPLCQEIVNSLNIRLPEYLNELILKSHELYCKKDTRSPYEQIKERKKWNDPNHFFGLLHMGVRNGLAAVLYNLQTFTALSSFVRLKGHELLSSHLYTTQGIAIPTQKMIYEYEHFMLHSRIVIDRINWWLAYFFLTNSGNLYKLYKHIKSNRKQDPIASRVASVIDKHRPFLDLHISTDKSVRKTERDIIAHREEIQFTTVNIQAVPPALVKVILVCNDREMKGEADEVLNQRCQKLFMFTKDLVNEFFEFKSGSNR
jgi:hypothetical protein